MEQSVLFKSIRSFARSIQPYADHVKDYSELSCVILVFLMDLREVECGDSTWQRAINFLCDMPGLHVVNVDLSQVAAAHVLLRTLGTDALEDAAAESAVQGASVHRVMRMYHLHTSVEIYLQTCSMLLLVRYPSHQTPRLLTRAGARVGSQ